MDQQTSIASQAVPIAQIDVLNRFRADTGDVSGLVFSMEREGQLQPILVRPHTTRPGRYILVAGARRLAAAAEIEGWTHIQALVKPMTDLEARVAELTENTQRVGFNHLDAGVAALEILPLFADSARARQLSSRFGAAGLADEPGSSKGRAKDYVAGLVGMSRGTLDSLLKVLLWCASDEDDPKASEFRDRLADNQPVKTVHDDWQRYLNSGADTLPTPAYEQQDTAPEEPGDISRERNKQIDELVARRRCENLTDALERVTETWGLFEQTRTRSEAEAVYAQFRVYARKLTEAAAGAYHDTSSNAHKIRAFIEDMREVGRVDDGANWSSTPRGPVYVGVLASRNGAYEEE